MAIYEDQNNYNENPVIEEEQDFGFIEDSSNEDFGFIPEDEDDDFGFIPDELDQTEEKDDDFSFFGDVANNIENIWESTKVLPSQAGLYRDNIIENIEEGVRSVATLTGLESEEGAVEHKRLSGDLREGRVSEAIGKIDEYTKNIKPTQEVISAFEEGNPEKIAASVVGSIIGVSDSMLKTIVSGGGYALTQPVFQSYSDTLLEQAEKEGRSPESLFFSNEDKEAIPLVTGVIQGALEKLSIGNLAKGTVFSKGFNDALKNIPMSSWRRIFDVAKKGGVEGVTEALQEMVGQVGSDISLDRDLDLDTRQILEAGAKGLVGGAAISGVSNIHSSKKAESEAKQAERDSEEAEKVNSIIRVGDIDVDSEVAVATKDSDEIAKRYRKDIEGTLDDLSQLTESDIENQINEGYATLTKDIDLETDSELNKIKLEKEKSDLEKDLEERISSESITKYEADILRESKIKSLEEKYSLELTQESDIDSEEIIEPYQKNQLDNDALKSIDELEVLKDESGEFNKRDLNEIKEIRDSISKEGLTKELDNKIVKLQIKRDANESKDLDFDKDQGSTLIGESIYKMRSLPTAIKSIGKTNEPAMKFLREKISDPLQEAEHESNSILRNEREILQDIISQANVTSEDLTSVGAYGFVNSTKADPNGDPELYKKERESNAKELIRAAENKVKKYDKKRAYLRGSKGKLDRARKELDVARSILSSVRNDSDFLNENQRMVYSHMTSILNQYSEPLQQLAKVHWDREFDLKHNYFPRKIMGSLKARDLDTENPYDDLTSDIPKFKRDSDAKIRESSNVKSIKGVSDNYYDMNAADAFMESIKSTTFDLKAVPAVKKISKMLKDKDLRKNLGEKSSDLLHSGVKSFVNNQKGVFKDELVKTIDKARGNVLSTIMGTLEQVPKQILPAVNQAFVETNANPATFSKALEKLVTLDDSWYAKNAKGIYQRGLSMDRLLFGGDEQAFKTVGETRGEKFKRKAKNFSSAVTEKPLSWADDKAAKLVFLASYIRMGGKFDKVDPKIIKRAEANQEALQNVNSTAYAGEFFNSKNPTTQLLAKTMFTFTNFALQQSFAMATGAVNLNTADGRRMFVGSITSALSFAAVSSALLGLTDELSDDILGEDDPEDDDKIIEDDFIKKVLIRGGADVAVGGVPFVNEKVKQLIEKINEFAQGSDYNKNETNIFYTGSGSDAKASDMLGAGLSNPGELIFEITNDLWNAATKEDDETSLKLAGYSTLALINYLFPYMPVPRGNFGKFIRDAKSELKREERRAKKASSRSNNRNARAININRISNRR